MYINELSFDDLIEIEIFREDRENEISFNTRVDGINNHVLKAVIPEYIEGLRDIREVNVYYKKDGKCKKWACNMLGFEKSNFVPLISLSCQLKAENSNRRNAFRLPYDEDMVYAFDDQKIKGRYKNLSAGGVGFYSNIDHEKGDKVNLTIKDRDFNIKIDGKIVRQIKQNNSNFKFLYGVKFEEENEKIMSYIFEKQGELIRKRKRTIKL